MNPQPQSFYQLNPCVIEHFRTSKVQLEILDQLDTAGGEASCEDILTGDERIQELAPLEANGIVRRIKGKGRLLQSLEISPTGRAIICSYREWMRHLDNQRLIMESQDYMREVRLQEQAASVVNLAPDGEPLLQVSDPEAKQFMHRGQWATAGLALERFDIKGPQLSKAATRANGLYKIKIERRKNSDGLYVYHLGGLQLLKDAIPDGDE